MKALLDHLCCQWMSHRPDPRMFRKIGLTIATTAGAGLAHATKTMRSSPNYWGMKRVYSCKNPVSAMRCGDVTEKRRAKAEKARRSCEIPFSEASSSR